MTPPPPEPVLHGGDLQAARAMFPDAPEPWIDLSTGINPCPYPIRDLDIESWGRLPQRSQEQALIAAAARRYGANNEKTVVAAPGTQALIQAIPRLIPPTSVAVIGPTYAEHAAAWRREGHAVSDVSDIASIGAARIVVIVNPNNPTGRTIPSAQLRSLASLLRERGGLLIVDEAFADVMPAEMSLVPDLPAAAIVLRSFGKMYGLAGLRLGFAIAGGDMAERLRDCLGPWAVSAPAITVGTTALADDGWRAAALEKLDDGRRRLDGMLTGCGFVILGGTSLFCLAHHPVAASVADVLGRHGLHVRRFPDHPQWLRFGLPGPAPAWRRLASALHEARRHA